MKSKLINFYDKYYKQLMIIPFLLLIFAILQISYQISSTGDFMNKGVSLKGGSVITLTKDQINIDNIDNKILEEKLKERFPKEDITIRDQSAYGVRNGIIIEATIEKNLDEYENVLISLIPGLTKEMIGKSLVSIGSSLGESFFQQTFKAMIFAFLFMGVVVFFLFRTFTPSIAVILAAFSDIIVTLSIINLLGIKVSSAGIAAFMMLIGYSVDTDILLSTKLLKKKRDSILTGILEAMKTGFTMSGTTFIAILVAYYFSISNEIKQIMLILLIGLVIDQIMTWIQNAGILRLYLEKQRNKNEQN